MQLLPDNPKFYRWLTQLCYWPLLIFIALWHSVLAPTNEVGLPTYLALIFWVVPLLLPMHGLIKGKPYTHAWFNFVLMFYFLHGLTAIYTHPAEWVYTLIELVLTSGAFVGATGYARYQGRAMGLGLKKLKDEQAEGES